MATFVEGEATETDSEDEQYFFNLSYKKVIPFKFPLEKFNFEIFYFR